MTRRVSLARKNLFQDRRRAGLAISGVGAALLLVLVLDGVVAGAMRSVTAYMRTSPADVFISQQDVRTLHMSQSILAVDTVEAARLIDGVAWVEGLRYTSSIVEVPGGGRRSTYVFGYETATGRGGPRQITHGRPPGPAEALVDVTAAGELDVDVGDTVVVLGQPFTVSGLSTNGTNIVNTTVFVRSEDFASLRGPSIAYVLVGAEPGVSATDLTQRLDEALPGVTVQTRAEFARQEAKLVSDMAADVMRIMSIIGFLIALAVVALTLLTATLGKLREYGVVKALGASSGRLAMIVAAQAGWSVGLGMVVAVGLAVVTGAAISALTPNLDVVIGVRSVVRTGLGALVIGAFAAMVPLRRVTTVDPATAFRRQ
ncbi:MAG: ABC transporter permease [Acidimicrobiales bacterium]